MKKQVLTVIVASFIAGSAFTAQAASTTTVSGGTIHFMGSVADAPCSVSADSEHGIVILDQVTLESMGTTAGVASGQTKAFNISLEDCDVTTYKNATVTFHGQSSPDQAGVLANTAGSGAATGVALQLYGPDGNKLDVEKESSMQSLSTGSNKIPLSVDYVTTSTTPTAGAVESVATFQITYS